MDVRRVIFCATGVIEFKIEGQISFNAQLRQGSLYDRSEVVRWATWSNQSSFSRFVNEPDGEGF